MKDVSGRLSAEEIDRLDEFLLERIDEDTDAEGKDEGVLGFSELDGLFTAIVTGPVLIPPSQWLPAVWGDFEPVWETEEEVQDILSLMMRHMNDIAGIFARRPQDYEPIFLQREAGSKVHTIVDEWCSGYLRGVSLAADEWNAGGEEMNRLLAPIMAFASETGWRMLDEMTDADVGRVQQAIAPNVREIYFRWYSQRQESRPPSATPVRRNAPRVGRNDPCPCGSGKKYKKCCLH